jgi:hypothetical protein
MAASRDGSLETGTMAGGASCMTVSSGGAKGAGQKGGRREEGGERVSTRGS